MVDNDTNSPDIPLPYAPASSDSEDEEEKEENSSSLSSDSEIEANSRTRPTQTIPFEVIGCTKERPYQDVFHRASSIIDHGTCVPVKLRV